MDFPDESRRFSEVEWHILFHAMRAAKEQSSASLQVRHLLSAVLIARQAAFAQSNDEHEKHSRSGEWPLSPDVPMPHNPSLHSSMESMPTLKPVPYQDIMFASDLRQMLIERKPLIDLLRDYSRRFLSTDEQLLPYQEQIRLTLLRSD